MAQLLGYVRLVGFLVAVVSSPAVVGGVVVFGSDLAVSGGLEEDTCTCCSGPYLRHLAETVVVAVVRAACTVGGKEVRAYLAVLGEHRGVEVRVDVIAGVLVDM